MEDETKDAADRGRGKRSRREALGVAVGAIAAFGVDALARPTPAQAGTDGDVVLGTDNQSTSGVTGVSSSASTALHGDSSLAGGIGVYGTGSVGVYGNASDTGVAGLGSSKGVTGQGDIGVEGTSSTGDGVLGYGTTGVEGHGSSANGVYGHTDSDTASGVFGLNVTGTGGYGVAGRSTAPPNGTDGVSQGAGVLGDNTSNGAGVWGHSDGGTGVLAESSGGTALSVKGKASFDRSGLVTIPSGTNRLKVNLGGVSGQSMVLATVQQAGAFFVKNVVAVSGAFTIYLNKAPASPTTVKVAYFVLD
jgi:hypothetical protein